MCDTLQESAENRLGGDVCHEETKTLGPAAERPKLSHAANNMKEPKSEAANPDGFSALAAVGEAQAHPWVRWGGLPGRRSHSSKTRWALGLISTVRIGAGAWRKLANTRQSGDTDQASTQIHGAQKRTQEQKEKRPEAFKERTTGRGPGTRAGSRWNR